MTQDTVNQDAKTEPALDSDINPTVNQDEKQNTIPQARFNEYVSKSKKEFETLNKQIASFKSKEDDRRKAQLEADGKQSELIAELSTENKTLREFKTDWDERQAQKRERLIEKIPENQRGIYSELSVDALEQHINMQTSNSKTPTNTQQPQRTGNDPNGGYANETDWALKDPKGFEAYLKREHNF